jgi:hypothetical protein
MKSKLYKISIVSVISFIVCHVFYLSWINNPPNYNTGAPGEFTCNVCHAPDNNNPLTGNFSISGLPDTVLPGQTYRIKVKLNLTGGAGITGGFQLTLIGQDLKQFGTLTDASPNAGIEQQIFRQYLEQHGPNTFANNEIEWEADWHSPDLTTLSQTFQLYATAIIGDGDSTALGDNQLTFRDSAFFKSDYVPMSLTLSKKDASCAGLENGYAIAAATGGVPPYTFQWSDGSNNPINDSLRAGAYRVTVSDSHQDTISRVITIREPAPVFGYIVKADIPCNSSTLADAIAVPTTGVSPFTYLWSNGDTSRITSFSHPGKIKVTITDSSSCTFTAEAFILNRDTFKITITDINNVSCHGGNNGSAKAVANIPFPTSYQWSDGQTTQTASNLPAGEYSVTVTSPQGCEVSKSVTIRETTPLSIKTNVKTNPSCHGSYNGVISIFADGGVPPYSYVWDDSTTNKTRINLIAGNYNVTVTDAFGCTASQSISLSEPDSLFILVDQVDETGLNSNDGRAAALVSGGNTPYRYAWSNGNTNQVQDNLAPGYYEITVTDVKGCIFGKTVFIHPYDCSLSIDSVSKTHILCYGEQSGEISVNASGGNAPYQYEWSDGKTGAEIQNLNAGTYHLTITDSTGCDVQGYFKINTPPKLIRQLKITDASAVFSVDGSIKITAGGGTAPFTIEVDGVDTIKNYSGIAEFKNLFNGLHSYSITDANGCSLSEFFIINVIGCQLNTQDNVIQDVKCHGDSTGAICLQVVNAQGPYDIFWEDESNGDCLRNLAAGAYSVYIYDSIGCQLLDTFLISEPALFAINSIEIDTPHVDQNDGAIFLSLAGGVPPYNVEWTKDGLPYTAPIQGLSGGDYHFIAHDANGCELTGDTIHLKEKTTAIKRKLSNKIIFYPNPTSEQVYFNSEMGKPGRIEMYSINGQEFKPEYTSEDNVTTITLTGMPNGVYVIHVIYDKMTYSGKILIVH